MIRIGREIQCLPYAGFFLNINYEYWFKSYGDVKCCQETYFLYFHNQNQKHNHQNHSGGFGDVTMKVLCENISTKLKR